MRIAGIAQRLTAAVKTLSNRLVGRSSELFDRDGWGPNLSMKYRKMSHYKGPHFPEPLHPRDALARQSSIAGTCDRARVAWSKRDFVTAEKLYREALQRAPGNADIIFELAQLLWLLSRNQEAKVLLARAHELDPNSYQAMVSLIELDSFENGPLVPRLLETNPPAPERVFYAAVRRAAPRDHHAHSGRH